MAQVVLGEEDRPAWPVVDKSFPIYRLHQALF
jgi:hypothetical protein